MKRRAIARGRMVPQSRSTDPRMGRISLKAVALYDKMWVNCDDQGRCSGDPDEIKYTACPNLPDISRKDIPNLLKELAATKPALLEVYTTSETDAIQMLDWWEEQKLQWAYPSLYPPPEGWTDHLRYHPIPTEIITQNWPPPPSELLPSELPSAPASALPSKLVSDRESSKEIIEREEGKGKGRGKGSLPSLLASKLGSKSSPSPTTDQPEILKELTQCFRVEWGRVPSGELDKITPREPGARESAQLRDLAKELATVGSVPLAFIEQAFRDAAGRPDKMHISYVRAILLSWLGVEK